VTFLLIHLHCKSHKNNIGDEDDNRRDGPMMQLPGGHAYFFSAQKHSEFFWFLCLECLECLEMLGWIWLCVLKCSEVTNFH
jgi:hypothetical protein